MVPPVATVAGCPTHHTSSKVFDPPHSSGPEPEISRLANLKHQWSSAGISQNASDLIALSWRNGTSKQYESGWKRWCDWCGKQSINHCTPTIAHVLNFLAHEHSTGKSYSTINSYRSSLSSALSPIDGYPVGKHPLVVRLMKGSFNSNPPKPKYANTWNVSSVLKYISSLPDNDQLSLPQLSHKLVALIALASAQRTQTLLNLDLTFLQLSDDCARFRIMSMLKTTSPKKQIGNLVVKIPRFENNSNLCALSALKEYIKRTDPLRSDNKLFISTRTLARWMKLLLASSGIDTAVFSAHSFRSASSTCAFAKGVSLDEIISTADWSNARTFHDFYLKPLQKDSFAINVLSSS